MPITLAMMRTAGESKRLPSRSGCDRRSYFLPQRQARVAMKYIIATPRLEYARPYRPKTPAPVASPKKAMNVDPGHHELT
jgi:hypothetical protein